MTGLTPVQTLGTAFVGVHYWFENDRGVKFADPASAGLGARVRMHLRGNTSAFLTVWMSDSTHKSLELTTRSDAGPEGRWTGYRLERDLDYVVNGEFEVAPVERATRIIFLLARSQTEQVDSFSGCQEKLQRIASRTASDGGSVLVREVDRATPGQVGTYLGTSQRRPSRGGIRNRFYARGKEVNRPLPPPRKLRRQLGVPPDESPRVNPRSAVHPATGGRTWWAHSRFTRGNIALTILKNQIEDLRQLGAFMVRMADVGKPYRLARVNAC